MCLCVKEKEVSSKHVLLRSEQDLAEVEVLGQLSPLNQASGITALNPYSVGIDFSCQNLTSVDVRF